MRVRVPLLPAVVRWAGVAAVAAFLFYVSVVTVPPETVVDSGRPAVFELDKWRHVVGYAGLAGALSYATCDRPWSTRRTTAVVIGVVAVYGVGIELVQAPLPERYFSVGDAAANALGAALVIPWLLAVRHLEFVPAGAWLRGLADRPRDG